MSHKLGAIPDSLAQTLVSLWAVGSATNHNMFTSNLMPGSSLMPSWHEDSLHTNKVEYTGILFYGSLESRVNICHRRFTF